MKLMIFLLIFSFNYVENAIAESANCEYYIGAKQKNIWYKLINFKSADKNYKCTLTLNNQLKADAEITEITGVHENSKTDDDVKQINQDGGLNLAIFPSILCEKFQNLIKIEWKNNNLKIIDENSLKYCENLEELLLNGNKINNLHKKSFKHQTKLKKLHLNNNHIEDLPPNVFAPLISMETLSLSENILKTINFDSFGQIKNLKYIWFGNNQLESFDERIIDNNLNLNAIEAGPNPCTDMNATFTGHAETKSKIRAELKKCFDKYLYIRVNSLHDDKLEMKKEIAENSHTIEAERKSTNDELKSIKINLKNSKDEAQYMKNEMQSQIRIVREEMKREIENLKRNDQTIHKSLNDEINLLKINHKTIESELKQAAAKDKQDLSQKLQSANLKIQDLTAKNKLLNDEIITLKAKDAELSTKVQRNENEIKRQIQVTEKSISDNVNKMQTSIEVIRKDFTDVKSSFKVTRDHFDKTLFTHTINYNQLMKTSRQLTAEYKTVTETLTDHAKNLIRDVTAMKPQIDILKSNIKELQKKHNNIKEEVDQIGGRFIPQIRKYIIDLKAADQDLMGSNLMIDLSVQNLNSTSEEMRIETRTINIEFKALKLKYYEFNDEIVKLQGEKRKLQEKIQAVENQMRNLSASNRESMVEIQSTQNNQIVSKNKSTKFEELAKKVDNLIVKVFNLENCCPKAVAEGTNSHEIGDY